MGTNSENRKFREKNRKDVIQYLKSKGKATNGNIENAAKYVIIDNGIKSVHSSSNPIEEGEELCKLSQKEKER